MPRMPAAEWVGEQSPRTLMSRYDIVCVHTIVGYAPAHAAHFSVRADGHIFQSRDTRYRSAANLNGNHRIIAIENEDHGPAFGPWPSPNNAPPLTDAQVEANAKILAWAHERHGVPLQLCPNSRPTSRGLAYHRQGIDGNFGPFRFPGRVSGGEVWTETPGKVCPTDNRIAQLATILAVARDGTPLEDDMTPEQEKTLRAIAADVDKLGTSFAAFREAERGRDQKLLQRVADLSDGIADEVVAKVATGIEPSQLKRIVRDEVIAGVRQTLGSLDEP